MPLGPDNQSTFYRLYANNQAKPLVSVTYRRRGTNTSPFSSGQENQGALTPYRLHNCREKKNFRSGEAITRDVTSSNRTVWQIPQQSFTLAGVPGAPLMLDQIIEDDGTTWNVENVNTITEQLFGQCWNMECLRLS